MAQFRNIDAAFRGMLEKLTTTGIATDSRNGKTIELTAQTVTIERPLERFLHTHERNNNPFAAIAETMWVIAGRNDLAYLTPYLRRAPSYSDDGGTTWRAGYGPRLRNWNGVDQIAETHALLNASPMSRRAVVSLFDPAADYQESRDIPCNNWLHFLLRDGHLDVNIAARSTDIWFGFSAINVFEWSVLLEMMARWLRVNVGTLTFFTSSLHLYAEHEDRARKVNACTALNPGYIGKDIFAYNTDWDDAEVAHAQWMSLEHRLRHGTNLEDLVIPFNDPMLVAYIRAIDIFWAFRRGATVDSLEPRLATLQESDLGMAARSFLSRPRAREH